MLQKRIRRTTLISLGCASFLAGLGIAYWHATPSAWWASGVILLLACIGKRLVIAAPAVVLAGGMLGIWRGSDMQLQLLAYEPYLGSTVTLTGTVITDPTYGNKGQRDFNLDHIKLDGRSPPGQVRITTFSPVEPQRGDTVRAQGKLYEGFGNYQAAVYFANVQVYAARGSPIETLRREFAAAIYSVVPEPQASLGLGILVGIKSTLPDSLNNQLKTLALTHIVVASGYNLTVLVRLSRRLFEKCSKYQTALAASLLMAGFVAVTGLSASMSRAVLVSGLSVVAWYYGRCVHPVTLLLFSAAITAGIYPIYLWSDIGWWLSFLAFAGVLVLAPLLQHRLWGQRQPKLLGQVVLETVAAQIATLPLLLAIFGNLSVLSLVANILIVPLVPLAMLLTFVGGMTGLLLRPVAAFAALPASWLLSYMTQVIAWLASFSWASVSVRITQLAMVGCYVALGVFAFLLWRSTKHDFLARGVIE